MDAQPARTQADSRHGQEQVFHRRRTVLQQVAQLPVMGRFEVAANDDPQRGVGDHLAVGQGIGDLPEPRAVADDDKAPRVFGTGRRRGHRGFEHGAHKFIAHRAGPVGAYAAAGEEQVEAGWRFRVHRLPNPTVGTGASSSGNCFGFAFCPGAEQCSRMADTKIDVKYVAHLARLKLSPEEEQKFGPQLDQLLGYIAKLNELDVSQVEPTAHAVPLVNVTRPDAARPSLPHEDALRNAPAQAGGLFVVPKIVE